MGLEDFRPLQVNVQLEMWTINTMKSDYRDEDITEFLQVVKRASGPALKYGKSDAAKRPAEDDLSSNKRAKIIDLTSDSE